MPGSVNTHKHVGRDFNVYALFTVERISKPRNHDECYIGIVIIHANLLNNIDDFVFHDGTCFVYNL